MNSVNIIGNLTKDVELRYNGDQAIAHFTVAVNGYKEKVDFIPVKVFGKSAEACNMYLKKGSKVGISGSISTGSYEKDGQKIYKWEVIGHVDFLGGKTVEKTPSGFDIVMDDIPF